jgi:hypothetical protein
MNGYGCNHPEVKQNPQLYAPYNEETLNVLLWKHNIQVGLLIYM